MSGPFRFGAEELGATEGGELDDALEAIRALEAAGGDVPVTAGPAFTDRVMAAIVDEPSPAPAGFLLPLRRRGLVAGFAESVRQAWASVAAPRPAFARAAALAYVLVVALAGVSIAGAATYGAAGALGLLGPQVTVAPTPAPPSVPPIAPSPSPASEPSSEPSVEPSESPEASDEPDHTGGGGEPEESDDHGGNSGPGGEGDGGGGDDGSGGSEETDSSGSGSSGPSESDDHADDSEDGGGSGSD